MLRTYPWTKLEAGEGFFVPALDLAAVKEAGLRAAVAQHVLKAGAIYAMHNGLIGVYFYLPGRARRLPVRFSLS